MEKIMLVAIIRKTVDNSFSDEDIHNGNYIDVIEKISIPSEDGDYSNYDAVATVTKKQSDFMKSILDENKVSIAYICI